MTGFAPEHSVNFAKMEYFVIEEAMKRDQMLMEAIPGHLLQSLEPLIGTIGIVQRLKIPVERQSRLFTLAYINNRD